MATLLQQAIDLAKAGERDAAETLIRQVLEADPNNEVAWIWLSGVSRDVLVKREALKRVLQLNPDNTLAKEGLKRFGGDEPPEPEEPEAPEVLPPEIPILPDEFPIGTPEPPAIAATPDEIPPVVADTPSANLPADVDWSVDAFAQDFSAPLPSAPSEDKPVFEDLPGDFDFDLDEPPVFDIDLDELTPNEPPALTGADDFSFGIADEIPAVSVPPLGEEPPPVEESASDRLEEMLANKGDTFESNFDTEIEEAPPIEPEELTIAEGLDSFEPETEEEVDVHELLRQKRQRQNRLLIIAAMFFALMVLASCSVYYYFTEIADIYVLMPQLAGETLQKDAPKPKNGISTIKFHGFPASSATLEWQVDTETPTCQGQSVGLKVDFANGDPPSLFSNRSCNGDACSFEKELTPGPIFNVEVTYICGKNASITLHK